MIKRHRYRLTFIVLALCFAASASAQRLALKTYNRSNGLASDYIICMMQDREGRIWFGTDRGVSCYNGRTYKTYTTSDGLQSNFIQCMFQDRAGSIWFGTYDGGASVFDGKRFRAFTTKEGLTSNSVSGVWQDKHDRIFFLAKTLCYLDADSTIHSLDPDVQGGYGPLPDSSFIVAKGGRLARMVSFPDSIHFIVYSLPKGEKLYLDSSLAFPYGRNVVYENGEYWIPSYDRILLVRFSEERRAFKREILVSRAVTACQSDGAGNVWVTTDRNGVAKIRGGNITWYTERDGFSRMRVLNVFRDYEGSLWFGTMGGGAQKLLNEQVRLFTTSEGLLQNDVTTVFADSKGRVWIGASRGVNVYERGRIRQMFTNGIENVRAFAEDKQGRLYIGAFSGLYGPLDLSKSPSLAKSPYRYISYGISGLVYRTDTSGTELFVSTFGDGLKRISHGNELHLTTQNGLPSNMSEGMSEGNNSIWLLTRSKGATRYAQGRIETFAMSEGLPSNMVNVVFEQSSRDTPVFWFGTDKGVTLLQGRSIQHFSDSTGMRGSNVIAIFQLRDSLKTMVIATDEALHRYRHGRVEPYGPLMILPSREMKVNSSFFDKRTSLLWLATTGGLVSIDPTKDRPALPPPKVMITRFAIDSTYYDLNPTRDFTFSHDDNNPVFEFTGLSYANEDRVRYRYALAGLDDNWSMLTTERRVQYRNLTEGKYEFIVVAVNPDGVSSTTQSKVAFRVLPPYWRTWWFRGFALMILAGGFGGVVRFISTRELRKRVAVLEREQAVQKERERISRDLHDHVGAQLVNIISGLDLVSKYSPPTETRAQRLLRSLQQDARLSMLQLRETIWAIKSQSMSLDRFAEQIENYSRRQTEFFDLHELEFQTNCDSQHELTPSQVLNCFRITQEAMTNSMKHSHADTVIVKVVSKDAALEIEVKDNGTGFRQTGNPVQGNGIRNMMKRADEIGATLTIFQPATGGTSVKLRLPLNSDRTTSALNTP
ncbi:MAG: hypothetical protein HY961_01220 [Ignavibacteriae bacterium]|nr:hypothetical protein [Ignavibacteriota bacterium]